MNACITLEGFAGYLRDALDLVITQSANRIAELQPDARTISRS